MTSIWRRPTRLRSAETELEERHATWFELFFDLVFVLAVGQLASIFTHDPTPTGFLEYAALFVPVWWAWVIYVTYADRSDTDDAVYRLVVMFGMLAVLAMAVSLPRAFSETEAAPFAVAYVVVRLVPLALYANAGRSLPIGRQLAIAYATATIPAAVLWLFGLALPTPARFAVWGARRRGGAGRHRRPVVALLRLYGRPAAATWLPGPSAVRVHAPADRRRHYRDRRGHAPRH